MSAARCRNCRRPIADAEKYQGFGRACWEKRRPRPLAEVIRVLPFARRAQQIADGQIAFDDAEDGAE